MPPLPVATCRSPEDLAPPSELQPNVSIQLPLSCVIMRSTGVISSSGQLQEQPRRRKSRSMRQTGSRSSMQRLGMGTRMP